MAAGKTHQSYLAESVILPPKEPKKHLSVHDRVVVDKVLANIINFMIEDNQSFGSLFERYDYNKSGFISLDDLELALYDDLNLKENDNIDLMVRHYLTNQQKVNIFKLR